MQEKYPSNLVKSLEHSEHSIEHRLGEFLASEPFLATLWEYPDETRDSALGFAMEYFLADPTPEHVQDYLHDLCIRVIDSERKGFGSSGAFQNRFSLMVQHLLHHKGLNVSKLEDAENIFTLINELAGNTHTYHAFNGTFLKSIQQHGLQPEMRAWDWDRLRPVDSILKRVGIGMGLGWANINSRGKTSLGDDPGNVYRYAIASPEWFAQFVAEGFHIPAREPYDKNAFYRRDHTAARKNVELFCDRTMKQSTPERVASGRGYPNMTAEEKELVLSFFEEYWAKLCGSNSAPMVALMKKASIGITIPTFSSYQAWINWTSKHLSGGASFEEYMRYCLASSHHDQQIHHAIPPESLMIINLPDYQTVHRISSLP